VSFEQLWAETLPIGLSDVVPGYHRLFGSRADWELREWFVDTAQRRGFSVEEDRVGNQWAWLGDPDDAASRNRPSLVLGSHLDSVPAGGAFDGALGVVSAFAAVDELRDAGQAPVGALGIVAFVEEEGSRFGITCAGSRVLTGSLDADHALGLRDIDGITLAESLTTLGRNPKTFGPDPDALRRIGTYIELHIEQGRALDPAGRSIAVGSAIRPYGRWRLTIDGQANHAGTTQLEDRDDPMLKLAQVITTARQAAAARGCVATIGKLDIEPNAINAIPSRVTAWLDARGPQSHLVKELAAEVGDLTGVLALEESFTHRERFDADLASTLSTLLDGAPILETGAGHDAGSLAAAGIRTAMLFVRNPTGVSHSPTESIEHADCIEGVHGLAKVIAALDS
jgi:N-carbamoyl-L-amino-acid hydrolase